MPPTANNLFPTSGNRRRKSRQYGAWLKQARSELPPHPIATRQVGEPPYSLEIELLFADGRRRDASNYIKPIEDLLSSWLGYDDALNYEIAVKKLRISGERSLARVRLSSLRHSLKPADLFATMHE